LRRRNRAGTGEGSKVPAYIVTFSDMVTLLLTFFVMLMTMAAFQDPELFNKGRDSFFKSLHSFGLGMLFGGVENPYFGQTKLKYYVKDADQQSESRSLDAKEEQVRRLLKRLRAFADMFPLEVAPGRTDFTVAGFRFAPGGAALDAGAKSYLTNWSLNLQRDPDFDTVKLYVLGLACEQGQQKQLWLLSARRAEAVATFLRASFPAGRRPPVYSWGAGPGGQWTGPDSVVSEGSQILIAVLRPG